VGVGLDHARHQGGAAAVDDLSARWIDPGFSSMSDLGDAVVLDEHLAQKGRVAGAVEDPDIGDEHARHVGFHPLISRWAASDCLGRTVYAT